MILTANYNDYGLKLCLPVANIFTHIFLAPCNKCEVIGYAVIDTRNEGRNFDFAQMIFMKNCATSTFSCAQMLSSL